jgi:putative transposase
VIASLTGQGNNVRHACRFLGVTESGYYAWKSRPTSPRALRRIFLAGQITEIHRDSAGVYGANRITAELRFGRRIVAGHNAVAAIMRELGIKGLPNRRLPRGARVDGPDLVRRVFAREAPDKLWMTDITEHPRARARSTAAASLMHSRAALPQQPTPPLSAWHAHTDRVRNPILQHQDAA